VIGAETSATLLSRHDGWASFVMSMHPVGKELRLFEGEFSLISKFVISFGCAHSFESRTLPHTAQWAALPRSLSKNVSGQHLSSGESRQLSDS
jgi:hypothetical protein